MPSATTSAIGAAEITIWLPSDPLWVGFGSSLWHSLLDAFKPIALSVRIPVTVTDGDRALKEYRERQCSEEGIWSARFTNTIELSIISYNVFLCKTAVS
jgi:hypothetical protein